VWKSKQSLALLAVDASLTRRFISAHVSEDDINVGVDDRLALGDGAVAFKDTQAIALPQELCQEVWLVVDVVVEVATGKIEDDLTQTAIVESLTLLALGC